MLTLADCLILLSYLRPLHGYIGRKFKILRPGTAPTTISPHIISSTHDWIRIMAAVTLPTFTGLKVNASAARPRVAGPPAAVVKFSAKASLKDISVAAAATVASAVIASNALAFDVLLGANDGGLVFVPDTFEVSSGEKIVFKNNEAFPHNVVFDDDGVPAGVDASKISMDEEAALNAKGEVYVVTLTEKGTYTFYCTPHRGAGMVGKVTVK